MRMLELADGCWKWYQWADGGGGGLFLEGEGAYMNRFGVELQGTTYYDPWYDRNNGEKGGFEK